MLRVLGYMLKGIFYISWRMFYVISLFRSVSRDLEKENNKMKKFQVVFLRKEKKLFESIHCLILHLTVLKTKPTQGIKIGKISFPLNFSKILKSLQQ